ncbi:hypothetical protein TSMEX_005441 [Taenia solium]|eukprot:TsM_000215100 transcript=TsM_000215100 gene=TsM_000215100
MSYSQKGLDKVASIGTRRGIVSMARRPTYFWQGNHGKPYEKTQYPSVSRIRQQAVLEVR